MQNRIISLGVAAVLYLSLTAHAQLVDNTKATSTIKPGINKSFSEEVGAGRGDIYTIDSSMFLINRDPFRAIRRGRQLFQRKFTRVEGQGPNNSDGSGDINTNDAIGAGLSAGVMGVVGYFFAARSVFLVTAALLIPALLVLRHLAAEEIDPERAHGSVPPPVRPPIDLGNLLKKRSLLIFGACLLLFHLANAAMLPLMGSVLTMRTSQWVTVLIGACLVGPQLVVAVFSPWVGRQAERWGRRPLLIAGFAALRALR